MSYCVINNTKGVYIRLNENGVPVTCTKDSATWFQTRNKAKNILNSLPKTLRRFHFFISEEIEPINNNSTNDIKDVKHDTKEIKVIEGTLNDDVNDEILEWLNKFGICDDIINEARKRITEVNISISNKDKALPKPFILSIRALYPEAFIVLFKSFSVNVTPKLSGKSSLKIADEVLRSKTI